MARLGLPQREAHLTETITLLVGLLMLIFHEDPLTLHQGEPTQKVATIQLGLRDRHRVTVKDAHVIMILFLGQNVHMLYWLVWIHVYSHSIIELLINMRFKFCKDDVPPRYAEAEVRQSRARMDYEMGGSSSQYGDAYNDRYAFYIAVFSFAWLDFWFNFLFGLWADLEDQT